MLQMAQVVRLLISVHPQVVKVGRKPQVATVVALRMGHIAAQTVALVTVVEVIPQIIGVLWLAVLAAAAAGMAVAVLCMVQKAVAVVVIPMHRWQRTLRIPKELNQVMAN